MFRVILEDLKAQFGAKVLLTPEDIADIIGVSVGQQANLRSEGRFPIPYKKDGGRVKISIYDLAKYLSGESEIHAKQEIKRITAPMSRSDRKATKGHLQGKWWSLRCKSIIAIIRKSNLSNDLRVNLINAPKDLGKI